MPQTFSLTARQLAAFDADGVLRLPGFFPASIVETMASRLWNDLEARFGARRNEPRTWPRGMAFKFQDLVRGGAFNLVDTPDLGAVMDTLVGAGAWDRPKVWGQPLVTFPDDQAWDLRRLAWHTDYPATALDRPLPAVRFFVYLGAVRPRGGATLVVRGSHLAMMALARDAGASIRSADARSLLEARSAWLRGLFSKCADDGDRVTRFMDQDGDLCGHPVRVVELTGEPGDLVLMHPGMLHTASPNVLDEPRLMLVKSIVARNWTSTIRY
ncbi:MAG TPA: phytanoyl-CoA dioxygenase family protein [Caulobacteraceae bacterium]|nr:phytanoyl-CoA dioxygenase family protein [Caulobacteraceae bacterium]